MQSQSGDSGPPPAGPAAHPALQCFHPAVRAWFARTLGAPTPCQQAAWPTLGRGGNLLLAAPTGSGKTLAAFLAALDALLREGLTGGLPAATRVLYVSPLRALSNDIARNLEAPLMGIRDELFLAGLPDVELRTAVRTGDTPQPARALMRRRPPHILVTTPESLYLLLTSESGRQALASVRTVIVDEIHALVGAKRGAHLALSLERLQRLTGPALSRVGLSATQKPLEAVARFLAGGEAGAPRPCKVVDLGHGRERDLAIELPPTPLAAVMSSEQWDALYDRLAELARAHRTTLVFVNTRRLTERLAFQLSERLGAEQVGAHHGSLSREQRLEAEQRLKSGALRVLVATASLELGIDIGEVDLVCQVGSTRAIGTLLQRVGRAGRRLEAVSKGRVFPLSRDELVEVAALLEAVRRGELDTLIMPEAPLDVLAQQVVAAVASEPEWDERALYALVRQAHPYRSLERTRFEAVVRMLAEGFSHRRGRSGAHLFRDGVNGRLRARRGARLTAIQNGGAIPDAALYEVRDRGDALLLGTLDEHFAIDSSIGDVFQLGNSAWRIVKVETGTVWVEDAGGQPPSIPFWFGEAPGRTLALSAAVSDLRSELERRLFPEPGGASAARAETAAAHAWLADELGLGAPAAGQILDYLLPARLALGALPTLGTLVVERFFDDAGGQQLVIHSPWGSQVNRAWGLALRKRFCRSFNFELQAAATEEAIVLSLGETHSFELDSVWRFLQSNTVREVLVQALLDAPMFATRWRWNACCALAIARRRGGQKVPPRLLRMQAEDLVSVVFPDQLACLENIQGERRIPDHPLVAQTVQDCLTEAMAIDVLEALLVDMEAGRVRLLSRDLTEPSPLAAEVLTARPYAFLDDAPLEERRTAAVQSRRWLDARTAEDLGRLDAEALERVRSEAWPSPESLDEVHDALLLLGFLTEAEADSGRPEPGRVSSGTAGPGGAGCGGALGTVQPAAWRGALQTLAEAGRALHVNLKGAPAPLWVAVERLPELAGLVTENDACAGLAAGPGAGTAACEVHQELLRSRLGALGPSTAVELGWPLGMDGPTTTGLLSALEAEGFVMRGRFDPGCQTEQWCERRLLARVHRYTVKRLRREIEAVSVAEYLRFLPGWQGVEGDGREGPGALERALACLEGFEAPAGAWESQLLTARVAGYTPEALDGRCQAGAVAWLKLRRSAIGVQAQPVKSTALSLVGRPALMAWLGTEALPRTGLGAQAAAIVQALSGRGASFFPELAQATGLDGPALEIGLAELVVRGLISSDSFAGLRALLTPESRRGGAGQGLDSAGRWALLAPPGEAQADAEAALEVRARALLRRWGVLCAALLEREPGAPRWGALVGLLRRLEARGSLRGGRFIAGLPGEQYALPEAVSALRESRRSAGRSEPRWTVVSGCDPLNLTGILTPGERLPALSAHRLLLREGWPVAWLAGERLALSAELDPDDHERAEALLRGQSVLRPAPALRRYLQPAGRRRPGARGAAAKRRPAVERRE